MILLNPMRYVAGHRNGIWIVPCLLLLALLASCKKEGGSASKPAMSISNVSESRSPTGSTFRFAVSLDQAAEQEVSVKYTTVDGTAKAGVDYRSASGTLVIPARQTSGYIEVAVTGDSLRRDNQVFNVQLSFPTNCTLINASATATIYNENLLYYPVDSSGYKSAANYPGYTLAWSDEFNGSGVNTNFWTFEQGNNNGWGNNELEYYTNLTNNSFVSAGNLIIEARKERDGTYTSARMITKGKKEFQYGRIDIRAKLPRGKGIWPALWMLGKNIDQVSWPACGEIDIMEFLGNETNKIYGTFHWGPNFAGRKSKTGSFILTSGSFDQQFHVYSLIWTAEKLVVLVDDQQYFQMFRNEVTDSYPFDAAFFLIFNVAVGGNWPGSPDGSTVFPQRMVVDYVRVFQ